MPARSTYLLTAAVHRADAASWELMLAVCPDVRFTGTGPVTALRRGGSWVSSVCARLRSAGLSVPAAAGDPVPQVVTVVGPRAELKRAVARAAAEHLPLAVLAFHPAGVPRPAGR